VHHLAHNLRISQALVYKVRPQHRQYQPKATEARSSPKVTSLEMAGDKIPSLYALDKPEKLDDLLKQDRGEDCLPCRIVGA
jgi:hypothetical protein